jgi:hypothetical protein
LRRVGAFGFRSARRKAGIFEIAERVIIDGEKTFATFFAEIFSTAIFERSRRTIRRRRSFRRAFATKGAGLVAFSFVRFARLV